MVEYRKAYACEADDILDFINYVFSEAHEPHNFKTREPEMYGGDYEFWKEHYVAVEDGRIRATLSVTEKDIERGGMNLKYGYVGQVSVHPYHRGKMYMRTLMHMAIDDMKAANYDLSSLGGLRQRYEYYGYVPADYRYRIHFNTINVRHALAGKESTVTAQGKEGNCVFFKDGKQVAKIHHWEYIDMEDYTLIAEVLDAYFKTTNCKSFNATIELYDTETARYLFSIGEGVNIDHCTQSLIFNYRRCIEAGLRDRAMAGVCEDGEVTVSVNGDTFGIRVQGSEVTIFDAKEAQYVFENAHELQKIIFCITDATDKRFPRGWFPLSLTF